MLFACPDWLLKLLMVFAILLLALLSISRRVIQVFRQFARNKLANWGWLSTGLFFLKQLFTPSCGESTSNLVKKVNYF